MKNKTLLPVTTLALALAPAVAAQTSPSQASGMASALAAGLSLDETNRTGPEDTLVKAPLNQVGPPAAFSGSNFSNIRDYSLAGLFAFEPTLAGVIEIDAQSTGNDLIPSLLTHPTKGGCYPNLGSSPAGNWMTITVSFDNLAVGRKNSLIRDRVNNTQGRKTPGSDIFSHYFLGSAGIAAALVNRTMVEQAAEQIAYPGDEDIDGLDFALGVQAHTQQTSLLFFPAADQFYFSLAPSCVGAVNLAVSNQFAWAPQQGTYVAADETTIYAVYWNFGQSAWNQPEVYLEPSALGLVRGVDDVDALAVNGMSGWPGGGSVIFSTQPQQGVSQLQGYDPGSGASGALRNVNGRKITRRLGAIDDTDDIDAICIFDPEEGMFGNHLGVPTRLLKPSKKFMGLSVTRGRVGGRKDNLIIQVSGWGAATPADSTVTLMIAENLPYNSPTWSAYWYEFAKQDRGANDEFVEWVIAIPPGFNIPNGALVAVLQDDAGTVLELSVVSQFHIN